MPIFIFTKERRNYDKTKRIATYISGTVAEPDLSDFEDDFHGNFSEFLTSCFKDRIDWYRISQNEELGKLPYGDVFGEKLGLIV